MEFFKNGIISREKYNYTRRKSTFIQGWINTGKEYDEKKFGKERVIGLIVANKNSSKELQIILTTAVEEFRGGELQADIVLIVISVQ